MIKILEIFIILLVVWIVISSSIMRFRYPKMTETELFLNIDNAMFFKPPR